MGELIAMQVFFTRKCNRSLRLRMRKKSQHTEWMSAQVIVLPVYLTAAQEKNIERQTRRSSQSVIAFK